MMCCCICDRSRFKRLLTGFTFDLKCSQEKCVMSVLWPPHSVCSRSHFKHSRVISLTSSSHVWATYLSLQGALRQIRRLTKIWKQIHSFPAALVSQFGFVPLCIVYLTERPFIPTQQYNSHHIVQTTNISARVWKMYSHQPPRRNYK